MIISALDQDLVNPALPDRIKPNYTNTCRSSGSRPAADSHYSTHFSPSFDTTNKNNVQVAVSERHIPFIMLRQ